MWYCSTAHVLCGVPLPEKLTGNFWPLASDVTWTGLSHKEKRLPFTSHWFSEYVADKITVSTTFATNLQDQLETSERWSVFPFVTGLSFLTEQCCFRWRLSRLRTARVLSLWNLCQRRRQEQVLPAGLRGVQPSSQSPHEPLHCDIPGHRGSAVVQRPASHAHHCNDPAGDESRVPVLWKMLPMQRRVVPSSHWWHREPSTTAQTDQTADQTVAGVETTAHGFGLCDRVNARPVLWDCVLVFWLSVERRLLHHSRGTVPVRSSYARCWSWVVMMSLYWSGSSFCCVQRNRFCQAERDEGGTALWIHVCVVVVGGGTPSQPRGGVRHYVVMWQWLRDGGGTNPVCCNSLTDMSFLLLFWGCWDLQTESFAQILVSSFVVLRVHCALPLHIFRGTLFCIENAGH